MAEELESNLSNYKLQFQQVEAALTTDPTNEDLLKLKKDLQEVLDLTQDLIHTQLTGELDEDASDPAAGSSAAEAVPEATPQVVRTHWRAGDRCQAPYSEDSGMYPATIDEILDDGTCTVTFDSYGNTEVTQVTQLKAIEEGKSGAEGEESNANKKPKTKRDMQAAEREYKKKKAQKKAQRLKQLEEESESDKNKWLSFNSKVFSKTNKGRVKRSIFASPDAVQGKVGVGTCGVSGRPMTHFPQHEKWKK